MFSRKIIFLYPNSLLHFLQNIKNVVKKKIRYFSFDYSIWLFIYFLGQLLLGSDSKETLDCLSPRWTLKSYLRWPVLIPEHSPNFAFFSLSFSLCLSLVSSRQWVTITGTEQISHTILRSQCTKPPHLHLLPHQAISCTELLCILGLVNPRSAPFLPPAVLPLINRPLHLPRLVSLLGFAVVFHVFSRKCEKTRVFFLALGFLVVFLVSQPRHP